MKLLRACGFACVVGLVLSAIGCGDEPQAETARSGVAAGAVFQTVPGHNKAEASDTYSCAGWTYRLLFGWEQHQDPTSPTGWYAAIGPSSVAATGTVLADVSADAYIQCYSGILPSGNAIDSQGRHLDDRLYVDMSANPAPCTLRTVWPTSWHLPDVVTPVFLTAYDYVPSINSNTQLGRLSIALMSPYPSDDPGRGWCGNSWKGVTILNVTKLPLPPPAAMPAPKVVPQQPLCSQVDNNAGCIVDPPCSGFSNINDERACLSASPPPAI